VRDCGLHIISRLRHNAAPYLPYPGPKPRRGPTPRYGDKLDYRHLPEEARVQAVTEGDLLSQTYQMTVWHKDFPDLLLVCYLHNRSRNSKSNLTL
jgi:putative transposase